MTSHAPTVFISWAHEDENRVAEVAHLATNLRTSGIDADVDLFHLHDDDIDWTRWGPQRVSEVDYVLIIASEPYRRRWEGTNEPTEGAGAAREADALHGIFDADQNDFQRKVKVVILPSVNRAIALPSDLYRLRRFELVALDQLDDLLRVLTGQPLYVPPPLGVVPALPPLDATANRVRPARSVAELVHERDQIRDDLRSAEQHLQALPQPELGEGPHLPWYREWTQTSSRIATLKAALDPLDALLEDLDLASELRRRNELQIEANELARRQLVTHEAETAPVIEVRVDGRHADDTTVESVLVVEHKQGGVARDLVVETDWGDAPAAKVLLVAGETTEARVSRPRALWEPGSDARPTGIRFVDTTGRRVQEDR